jgi:hypothetical protein
MGHRLLLPARPGRIARCQAPLTVFYKTGPTWTVDNHLARHGAVSWPTEGALMQVQFIASVAVIAPDPAVSRRLYLDVLGLPLEPLDEEYYASDKIGGSKHFGVWPLSQAAEACFGTPQWPADRVVPQASVEFELESPEAVGPAAQELRRSGFELLHDARIEPWGQTVARMQSAEGLIVGLSFAPSLHPDSAAG